MFSDQTEFVAWPDGAADVLTPDYAATIAVTVRNKMTVIAPAQLTGNATLNITPASQLAAGAIVVLKVKATTNSFDMTLGSSIDGPNIVGVATKTKTQAFVFDGANFIPTGAAVQID